MITLLSDDEHVLPPDSTFALQPMLPLEPDLFRQLHVDERKQLDRLKNEKRRREFVTSRLALRELAGSWGLAERDFSIYKNELGNPFASAGGSTLQVSIAHTRDMVFCGLSRQHAIGVDLEPVDRDVPDRLRSRMMHPLEKEQALSISTIRLWTLKEAYIKLRGEGLRLNMNEVWVKRERDYFVVEFDNEKKAKICSFQYQDNWLAIAYYL